MKKKTLLGFILVTFLFWTSISEASAESLAWSKSLTQGRDISYWIAPGNEYTVSIPRAVQKLMYPGNGMSNCLVLSRTTVNQQSKLDLHQYTDRWDQGTLGYTELFRKNSSGKYYAMYISELNTHDWVYGEVNINDYYLQHETSAIKEKVILHEMLHVYGLRDLYNTSNRHSIMYWDIRGSATGLTSDANGVLNSKY